MKAVAANNLELVKWLLEKSGLTFDQLKQSDLSVRRLAILRYLIDQKILKPTQETIDTAAFLDNQPAVKWLSETPPETETFQRCFR